MSNQTWSKTEDGSDRCTTHYDDGSSRDATREQDGSITVTDHSPSGESVTGRGATGILSGLSSAVRLSK